MSAVSERAVSRRPRRRLTISSHLPHWSEVAGRPDDKQHPRPSPTVAAVLRDLVGWAADVAILLTRHCPEDRAAIERVRRFSLAWLSGKPCPDLEITDVLTTAAGLMAEIDRSLGISADTNPEQDERQAIGAPVTA